MLGSFTLPKVKRDLLMEEASFSMPFSALVSFTRSLPACAQASNISGPTIIGLAERPFSQAAVSEDAGRLSTWDSMHSPSHYSQHALQGAGRLDLANSFTLGECLGIIYCKPNCD